MGGLQIGGAADDLAGLARGRSNSTSTVVPIAAALKADCWLSIRCWSRANRSSISAVTPSPASPPPAFPAAANI